MPLTLKNWKSRSVRFMNYLWKMETQQTWCVDQNTTYESRYTKYEQLLIYFSFIECNGLMIIHYNNNDAKQQTASVNHSVNETDNVRVPFTTLFLGNKQHMKTKSLFLFTKNGVFAFAFIWPVKNIVHCSRHHSYVCFEFWIW